MAVKLNSHIGKISLLDKNARIIRDSAFNRLVESIKQDPEFLMARGVVVWQVPQYLAVPEGEKNPFSGQEGQMVVIGGNQRCKAFMALGMTEIKREWLIEAKDEDGNWWSPDKAERFVLKDNNPEGLAGENDVKKMFENFSEVNMRLSGIDFSAFQGLVGLAKPSDGDDEEDEDTPTDRAEKSEYGEKDPELKEFIEHRESSRKDMKEISEFGFHLLLVFGSFAEKAEFISKAGLTGNDKVVAASGDVYVDLVFETYDQKAEFLTKAGLAGGDTEEDGELKIVYGMFADGRAFARRFGIELESSMLHFRDPKVDARLKSMARDDAVQKSPKEIDEALFKERKSSSEEIRKFLEKNPEFVDQFIEAEREAEEADAEAGEEAGDGMYVSDDYASEDDAPPADEGGEPEPEPESEPVKKPSRKGGRGRR